MAGWASVTDNSSCGSNRSSALSSSDGEFLAEADFASAVAKVRSVLSRSSQNSAVSLKLQIPQKLSTWLNSTSDGFAGCGVVWIDGSGLHHLRGPVSHQRRKERGTSPGSR